MKYEFDLTGWRIYGRGDSKEEAWKEALIALLDGSPWNIPLDEDIKIIRGYPKDQKEAIELYEAQMEARRKVKGF